MGWTPGKRSGAEPAVGPGRPLDRWAGFKVPLTDRLVAVKGHGVLALVARSSGSCATLRSLHRSMPRPPG